MEGNEEFSANSNDESNEIFISYRRADVEFAKKIYHELKKSGHSIWVDWEDIPPGVEGFSDEIQRGIEGAIAFICILSPGYLESEYCLTELREAIRLKKRVIPVVLKKFEPMPVPEGIGHINWVYFTPHAGHENTFEESFSRMLQAIRSDYEHSRLHTRLLLRAIDWEKNDRGAGYLLKDAELDKAEHWQVAAAGKNPAPTELQGEYILAGRAQQRQQQRRFMAVIGALLVVAIIAAVFAGFQWKAAKDSENLALEARDFAKAQEAFALSEKNRAEAAEEDALQAKDDAERQRAIADDQAENALISSLAAQSQLIRRRQLGLLVALEAYYASEKKNYVSPMVQTSLRTALVDFGGIPVQSYNSHPMFVLFSPDERWLVSAAIDGQIQISDESMGLNAGPESLIDRNSELTLIPGSNDKPVLVISPDSRWLAGIFLADEETGRREIHVWDLNDLTSGSHSLRLPEGVEVSALKLAFGNMAGEYRLVAGLVDGSIYMWDAGADLPQVEPVLFKATNKGPVHQLAFSPDGTWLAAAFNFKHSDEGAVLANPMMLIWNLKTPGREPLPVDLIQVPLDNNLIFSSSGKWLVGAAGTKLRLWNMDAITSNRSAQAYDVPAITDVALSADDQWVAAVGGTEAYVWNLNNFSRIDLPGYNDYVLTAGFSPDGHWLATGDYDGQIRLWNTGNFLETNAAPTESEARVFKGFDVAVWSLKFSADGSQMAAAGDQQVRVWDFLSPLADPVRTTYYQSVNLSDLKNAIAIQTSDKEMVITDLSGDVPVITVRIKHPRPISYFYSPDKSYLAVNSGKIVEVWDLQNPSEQPIFKKEIQTGLFEKPVFTADERWFVYTVHNQIFAVDLEKSDELVMLSGNRSVLPISEFYRIENWLISTSSAEIIAWDAKDGFSTMVKLSSVAGSSIIPPTEDSPTWLFVQQQDSLSAWKVAALSAPELVLEGEAFPQIVRDRWLLTTLNNGQARLRDLTNPDAAVVDVSAVYGFSGPPDYNWFYYYDEYGVLHLLDLTNGDAQAVSDGISPDSSLLFSPDDRWLAVTLSSEIPEEPASTLLYQLTNGIQEFEISSGYSPGFFSPNGNWLTLSDAEENIALYDLQTYEILPVAFQWGSSTSAFSKDEHWWIVQNYENKKLSIYDLQAHKLVETSYPPTSNFHLSEYGDWVVSTLSANNTDTMLVNLNDPQKFYLLTSHTDVITGRVFMQDKRTLLTFGWDGTIRIWDLQDLAADPVVLSHGEGRRIDEVKLSENGKWLISNSGQGLEIYVWRWDFEDVVDLACQLVGRNLSLEEWTKYFGNPDEYSKTCENWELEVGAK